MPRQLRALHVIGDSKFGGGDVVVCGLLKLLQEHDIDVTLLATDPSAIEYAEGQGLKVWPFQGICRQIRPVRDLWAAARLARAIRGKYDIVHTHTTKGGAIGRTAAWLARVPARLHHVHGFSFHEFTGKWTTRLMASAERKLGRMCDRLIFVNSFDREKAIEMGIIPAAKAVTVYNGLPEERLAPGRGVRREELLAELSLPDDAILSVNVGRLAPQKGLVYLFEALGILRRERPDLAIHQVLIGDGELMDDCKAWAEQHGVTDRVHLLGFRSDAVRWTGGCDMFVLSSLWEGHSITLLEAMGLGRPIVATDIKGNRESITHEKDGLLVAPAAAAPLAEGMVRMACDRELAARLGEGAERTFQERFTLEEMLRQSWQVYEDLLAQKGLLEEGRR